MNKDSTNNTQHPDVLFLEGEILFFLLRSFFENFLRFFFETLMGWWQRVGGITSTIPLLSFSSPSPLLHSPFLSPSLLPSRTSALSAQTKHLFASGERFGGGRGEGGGGRGGGRDGDNIFVSSYYREISKEEVLDYLKTKSIQFKDGIPPKEWAVVKYCSNCPPHKGQLDNLFKLYIYKVLISVSLFSFFFFLFLFLTNFLSL